MVRVVAVNERGLRLGEDHQNARLTNCEVDAIRDLYDQGLSYRTLAEKFDVSKSTIAMIVRCERRAGIVKQWKTLLPGIKQSTTVCRLLPPQDCARIRELRAEGMSIGSLAQHFRVPKDYVAKICSDNNAQVAMASAHSNQENGRAH